MRNRPASDVDARQTLMFCIGAQKAGTTWLWAQIKDQEDVFLARPKELHYWDCIRAPYLAQFEVRARERMHVPSAGSPIRYRLSRFWTPYLRRRIASADQYADIYDTTPYDHSAYLSYVGLGRPDARLVGDITPSYALLGRETYGEMLACAQDVRFVFIMRDPVARLWSGLHQQLRKKLKNPAFAESDMVRRFRSVCGTPADPNFLKSDYPATIRELEAAVPASRIHYCFFETLLSPGTGAQERADLARFIGVPAACLKLEEKVHASEGNYRMDEESQTMARAAMAGIYSALREKFGPRIPDSWER